MTNHEKYKRAFGALHPSEQFTMEVNKMKTDRKFAFSRPAVAALAVCVLVIGTLTAAYAADIGGFRETVSVWINGSRQEAYVEQTDDGFAFTVETGDEPLHSIVIGTVIEDGVERALTEEEALALINDGVSLEEDDNGRVWLYFYDEQVDITDRFDENGLCEIDVTHEGETEHLEITSEGDGSYSYVTEQ